MKALRSLLFPCLAALVGCRSVTPPGVLLATTPRGAQVWVDGERAGLATPCQVALDLDADHVIRFELAGYRSKEVEVLENPGNSSFPLSWADFVLRHPHQYGFEPWSYGRFAYADWPFPLFLPSPEFVLPVQLDRSLYPARIHVHLAPVE